ncbi:MarR family winged helix-turn-helix transcriptional regulator [Amycolatopsis sp. NBC_01480]|uniref:MarR family winged helix-turn-helix transcriptional regulator n=1 Tax=Amycolatopsis sp. NBC_01480 TaxID=2903562 RepID=UPI002E2B3F13|nr:MarR family winged helix-turn-helix transcriptional regulator [Amycolatopsis sp. NBC_01480]
MSHPQAKTHRMSEFTESIGTVTFSGIPNEGFLALGMRNYWDGYFAGRAAPLGLAPAEVVHAVFYNFADGEVARHIPWVWGKTTPEEAIAVRERGSAAALRQMIGDLADSSGLARAADLATRAAVSAPIEGRALYAGLRALAVPEEPVARLWHAATLLREHRGDGHNIALAAHGIGGTEAHVLCALAHGMRPEEFGRIHHLPKPQLAAVIDGLRDRGLVNAAGGFTDTGRATRERIETLTDELAAPAYDVLSVAELDELIAGLEPICAAVDAAGD